MTVVRGGAEQRPVPDRAAPPGERRDPAATSAVDRLLTSLTGVRTGPAVLLLAAMLALATATVLLSGGTHRALPHVYYLPIFVAAMQFGVRGAVPVAVAAGLLCGPAMPLDTEAGTAQPLAVWVSRLVAFVLVGAFAGVVVRLRDKASRERLTADVRSTVSPHPSAPAPDPALLPLVGDVLTSHSFHVDYQPIYRVGDGSLAAVEALTRVDAAVDAPPNRWFAAAHAMGCGVDLELSAMEAALAGARDLPPGVVLTINASPQALADPRTLDLVRRHPGRQLVVEITEHAAIEDYPLLRRALAPLRAFGVGLAVDDAGAGFASLRHVVQLEPEIIKLDMSLTQHVGSSNLRTALAASLVEFATSTGAMLVAEGVESAEDLAEWKRLGVYAVQGWCTGRPGDLPFPVRSRALTHHPR